MAAKYQILDGLSPEYIKRLRVRFWKRVNKRGPRDCWEWAARIHRVKGYGAISVYNSNKRRDRDVGVHRVVYELETGPIPPGMYICHKCDNRKCVNPDHLIAASAKFNAHDMNAKGGHRFGINHKRL